jgi:ribose transport system substrate-binding protein
MKVVYYLPNLDNPFWREVVAGIKNRADTEKIQLEVVKCVGDPSAQATRIQDYPKRGADAVFVSPIEMQGLPAACKAIKNAGVPILCIDQNLNPSVTASIMSGNIKGGMMAASYIAERLGPGKRVVQVVAHHNLSNVEIRSSSFAEEISKKGLVIVKRIQGDSNSAVATSEMLEFLRQRVSFDAIFAENDNLALGVIKALKAENYSPLPVVVGYDGVPEALDAIQKGDLSATIAQNPRELGETAIDILLKIIKGEQFDSLRTIHPRLVTKNNLM